MARPLVGPPASCALHGAILTAAAIPGVIPLVHSTPGCALRAGTGVTGDLSGAPPGLPLVASTNLAEKHVVFGGTSRLREEIKNTLAVVESGLVAVLTGCPTEMIGDDVAAMVKEVTSQGEAVIDIQTAGFRGPARAGYDLLMSAFASRSARRTVAGIAPNSTKPAPFRITGKRARLSRSAARAMLAAPPGEGSMSSGSGSSMSICRVHRSRGTLICAGAEARRAFWITRFSTSAMRTGSRSSSCRAAMSRKAAICSTS